MITVHTTSCCACLHCGFLHPSIPSLCMLKFPLLKEKNEIWAEANQHRYHMQLWHVRRIPPTQRWGPREMFARAILSIAHCSIINPDSLWIVSNMHHGTSKDWVKSRQDCIQRDHAGPQDNETRTVSQDDCHRNRWSYCVARLQGVGVRAKNKLGQWLSTNWIFCATLRLSWFCKWGCACVCRAVVFSSFFVVIAIRYQCCWML